MPLGILWLLPNVLRYSLGDMRVSVRSAYVLWGRDSQRWYELYRRMVGRVRGDKLIGCENPVGSLDPSYGRSRNTVESPACVTWLIAIGSYALRTPCGRGLRRPRVKVDATTTWFTCMYGCNGGLLSLGRVKIKTVPEGQAEKQGREISMLNGCSVEEAARLPCSG